MATGELYTQGTGLKQSYLEQMKLIVKAKAKLVSTYIKKETSATQKNHNWPYDSVAIPAANNANVEGATITPDAPAAFGEGVNYLQIIDQPYQISGTQAASMYHGVNKSYLAHQKMKALEIIGLAEEYAVLRSTGLSGDSTHGREMKSLTVFAAANTDCTATGVASTFSTSTGEGVLNGMLKLQWLQGVIPDLLIVSATNKGRIDSWTGGMTRYQETKDGRIVPTLSVYESNYGRIEILMHPMANDTDILSVQTSDLALAYLRRPFTKELGVIADGVAFDAIMEVTLEVRGPYSAAYTVLS